MTVDISRPVSDYLPKGSGGIGGRLWKSLLLLLLAITIAAAAAFLTLWLAQQVVPGAPPYIGLLGGLAALIVSLQVIARRFEWIMPWYYLLPSILFLLTFALFPVVLTIILAFTDYAGIRNGELNISSRTDITETQGNTVTVADSATLRCEALRNGCTDVPAIIDVSGTSVVAATALNGTTLTLAEPLPEGASPSVVTLELTDIGFSAEFNITAAEGNTLTLERAPPGEVDLESVGLEVPSEGVRRTMLAVEGNTITLDAPLPEGQAYVAITRYNDFGLVGFQNFRQILSQAGRALGPVFVWNLLFAVSTVLINTVFGVFLAIFLNNPDLRFRNLYRTLLIIPWALPSIITIQVWKGFLNSNFGAINRSLALLDLPVFDWLGEVWPARSAILLVNLWLGLPFMMTATLGALSAIPEDLYEAAKIDGANVWRRVTGVTLPLLRTALVPITLTGFAFNFNNFGLIYLLTGGGPGYEGGTSTARGTDILISWAYNEAFQAVGGYAYGLGSAISLLIFFITIAVSLINFRVTGALKEESNI